MVAARAERGGRSRRDHAAALVGVEPAAVRKAAALVPDERLVRARPVHVAPAHRAAVGALVHQLVPGILPDADARRIGRIVDEAQPADGVVIDVAAGHRARRRQPVLDSIAVGRGPDRVDVAVGVMGDRGAAERGELVEPVGRADDVRIGQDEAVGIVRARVRRDLAGRIVAVAERHVVGAGTGSAGWTMRSGVSLSVSRGKTKKPATRAGSLESGIGLGIEIPKIVQVSRDMQNLYTPLGRGIFRIGFGRKKSRYV